MKLFDMALPQKYSMYMDANIKAAPFSSACFQDVYDCQLIELSKELVVPDSGRTSVGLCESIETDKVDRLFMNEVAEEFGRQLIELGIIKISVNKCTKPYHYGLNAKMYLLKSQKGGEE